LFIAGANGRPVSYSFEHIAASSPPPPADTSGLRTWSSGGGGNGNNNNPPLPPRRPYAYGDVTRQEHGLSLSDHQRQHLNVARSVSAPTSTAVDSNTGYLPQLAAPPRRNEDSASFLNYIDPASSFYVDSAPRSRKPVMDLSPGSSHHLDKDDQQHLPWPDADRFWAPHFTRLQHQHQLLNSSVPTTTDSSPPDSLTDSTLSERPLKTPNRDSAIVSNLSTPMPPNCDSSTGKSSPSSSLSSKDSGCSEASFGQEPVMLQPLQGQSEAVEMDSDYHKESNRNDLTNTVMADSKECDSPPPDGGSLPGFSTQKRRARFRTAMVELETIFQQIARDEDLLDRAERRDLPTPHQATTSSS
jgi:hypothetical protein